MTKQEFQEFLEQNREKIRKTIPTNPSITKDDEWRDDRHNDQHYAQNLSCGFIKNHENKFSLDKCVKIHAACVYKD